MQRAQRATASFQKPKVGTHCPAGPAEGLGCRRAVEGIWKRGRERAGGGPGAAASTGPRPSPPAPKKGAEIDTGSSRRGWARSSCSGRPPAVGGLQGQGQGQGPLRAAGRSPRTCGTPTASAPAPPTPRASSCCAASPSPSSTPTRQAPSPASRTCEPRTWSPSSRASSWWCRTCSRPRNAGGCRRPSTASGSTRPTAPTSTRGKTRPSSAATACPSSIPTLSSSSGSGYGLTSHRWGTAAPSASTARCGTTGTARATSSGSTWT